jgi:hypothetical protein
MAKQTSNLKVVQQQTLSEAELQGKAERQKKWSEESSRWEKAENELLVSGGKQDSASVFFVMSSKHTANEWKACRSISHAAICLPRSVSTTITKDTRLNSWKI